MKLTASCKGDISVGIFGCTVFVEFPDEIVTESDGCYRDSLRESFRTFANELFDEKASVWFSDEQEQMFGL